MADTHHDRNADAISWVTARLWNDVAAQHAVLYETIDADPRQRADFCYAVATMARSMSQLSGGDGAAGRALEVAARSGERPSLLMAVQAVEALCEGERDIAGDIVDSYADTPAGTALFAQELADVTIAYMVDLANSNGTTVFDEIGRWGLISARARTEL